MRLESVQKNSFVSLRFRFAGGNKNITQKIGEKKIADKIRVICNFTWSLKINQRINPDIQSRNIKNIKQP